jgi:hypothetical protein
MIATLYRLTIYRQPIGRIAEYDDLLEQLQRSCLG